MSSSRQVHLDALRGVAAVIVVVDHYLAAFHPFAVFGSQNGTYPEQARWESWFHQPPLSLLIAGPFAVCFFFVLSGYVLALPYLGQENARASLLAATVRRPVRLGGLLLATVLIGACLWQGGWFHNHAAAAISHSVPWFAGFWPGTGNLWACVQQMLRMPWYASANYNPPLWTILCEWYGSLLVFMTIYLMPRSRWRWALMAFLFLYFHGSLFHGFIVGMALADATPWLRRIGTPAQGVALAVIAVVPAFYLAGYPDFLAPAERASTCYGWLPPLPLLGGGYPMLGALLVFGVVSLLPRVQQGLARPAWQFLGGISYSLYAVHFLVLGAWSAWVYVLAAPRVGTDWAFVLSLLLGWPPTLAIAWLADRLVDRPTIRLAARLGTWVRQRLQHPTALLADTDAAGPELK